MRKSIALAALAAACALAPASPASAAGTIQLTGHGQMLPSTSIHETDVTWECTARAEGDAAASVAIKRCEIVNASGQTWSAQRLALPGPFAATAGKARVPMSSAFRVCVEAEVAWVDGTFTSRSICS